MKLHALTITEASALLEKQEISSVELTRAVLQRIDRLDGKIKAYLTPCNNFRF